jgi:hypothetical protein
VRNVKAGLESMARFHVQGKGTESQVRRIHGPKHRLGAEVAAHGKRRLTKRPPESPPHALAVRKTRLPRDNFDRMSPLLHQKPCSFDPELLDRLCGRLPGFGREGSRELTRAEVRGFRKVLDGEALVEIFPRKCERGLDAIGLRLYFEQRRELGLSSSATVMKDELPGYGARHLYPDVFLDESQYQVDRGSHSGRRPNSIVFDENTIFLDLDAGKLLPQTARKQPMRGRASPVEKTRFRKRERANTGGRDATSNLGCLPHEINHARRGVGPFPSTNDQCIEPCLVERFRLDQSPDR